jgi:hypothetical protein
MALLAIRRLLTVSSGVRGIAVVVLRCTRGSLVPGTTRPYPAQWQL